MTPDAKAAYDTMFQFGNDDAIPSRLTRDEYESACAAFGVGALASETCAALAGAEYGPQAWTDLGRDGRVSWLLAFAHAAALPRRTAPTYVGVPTMTVTEARRYNHEEE